MTSGCSYQSPVMDGAIQTKEQPRSNTVVLQYFLFKRRRKSVCSKITVCLCVYPKIIIYLHMVIKNTEVFNCKAYRATEDIEENRTDDHFFSEPIVMF